MSRDKFLRQTMINQNRKKNKSYINIHKMLKLLKKGEEIYYFTKNVSWFKQKFKDVTALDINLVKQGPEKCNMYLLKLK